MASASMMSRIMPAVGGVVGLWATQRRLAHASVAAATGAPAPARALEQVEITYPRGMSLEEALARPRPSVVREQWPLPSEDQRFWEPGKIWYKKPGGGDQPERKWEVVRRKVRNASADGKPLEAANVVATVRRAGREPGVVLVLNYRPPVDAFVVELPAGLVDGGETAMQAAVRELEEETGFVATEQLEVHGPCFPDPWKSRESYMSCTVDIDGDDPRNREPQPKHQAGEHFGAVLVVPLSALLRALVELESVHKCKLETRLVGIAEGIDLARRLALPARRAPAPASRL